MISCSVINKLARPDIFSEAGGEGLHIYGYTIENLSNTDTQIILTYRHRGHSLNTGIDTMASGQYTPNKKNVDIHKSYYRVLNHFFQATSS